MKRVLLILLSLFSGLLIPILIYSPVKAESWSRPTQLTNLTVGSSCISICSDGSKIAFGSNGTVFLTCQLDTNLTPTPTSSPELEPFPTTLVLVSIVVLVVIGIGIIFYLKKSKLR